MQAACVALLLSALAFAPDSPVRYGTVPPVLIRSVKAEYTQQARDAGVQGEVWLSVVVDEKGVPAEVTVTRPLEPSLDASAVQAVKAYRFKPGLKAGSPAAITTTVRLHFGPPNSR